MILVLFMRKKAFGCDLGCLTAVWVCFLGFYTGEAVFRADGTVADRFSEKRSKWDRFFSEKKSKRDRFFGKTILAVSFLCDSTPMRIESPRPLCTEGVLRPVLSELIFPAPRYIVSSLC